jgi:hypothetical protein
LIVPELCSYTATGPGVVAGPVTIAEIHLPIDAALDIVSPNHTEIDDIEKNTPLFMMDEIQQRIGTMPTHDHTLQDIVIFWRDPIAFTFNLNIKRFPITFFLQRRLYA